MMAKSSACDSQNRGQKVLRRSASISSATAICEANVEVEHIITPYIQRNEAAEITKRMTANGGKPIESQLESIRRYGVSPDAEATMAAIREEEKEDNERQITDIFGSAN